MEGIDYSFSRPTPDEILRAGKQFVVRYIQGNGKRIDGGEIKALHERGIAIFLCHETWANAWTGGYATGVEHAGTWNLFRKAHSVPNTVIPIFCIDTEVTSSEQDVKVREFLKGARDILGDRIGVYGQYRVMESVNAALYWQTYAWSGRQWSPRSTLHQYRNDVRLGTGIVDLNWASSLKGAWLPPNVTAETHTTPYTAPTLHNTVTVEKWPGKLSTMSGIAAAHKMSLGTLLGYNPHIKDANVIHPGQIINLGPTQSRRSTVITVEKWPGQLSTLSGIAAAYNTTVDELCRKNPGITNRNIIYPGQKIEV